jgi:peroxiredoxin
MKLKCRFGPQALLLLALAGCTIERVEEHRESGTLYFRAINAYDDTQAVGGLLAIEGRSNLSFVEGSGYLPITDLPLDSNLVLNFTPYDTGQWRPVVSRVFRLSSAQDTLSQMVYPRSDLTLHVVTMTGSGPMSGMPIYLDGQRWSEDSPATIIFTDFESHRLVVGDDECTRADTTFSYTDQPSEDMIIDVGSVSMTIDPGLDGLLLLNDAELGQGLWSQLDPVMGSYFFSAFRPGHVAAPVWIRLSGLCGGSRNFTWTPTAEGYAAGQLFPDFTLAQVDPGQAGTLGDFSLRLLRGRLVLVTFWYATCVNCLLEMPGFQNMLDEYGARGFRVVAMDPYPTDFPENYPVEVWDYDFTFVRDVGSPPVAQQAGVGAFPTNFLVLPDGSIQSVRGGMSEADLEALLLEYLPE